MTEAPLALIRKLADLRAKVARIRVLLPEDVQSFVERRTEAEALILKLFLALQGTSDLAIMASPTRGWVFPATPVVPSTCWRAASLRWSTKRRGTIATICSRLLRPPRSPRSPSTTHLESRLRLATVRCEVVSLPDGVGRGARWRASRRRA